MDTVVHAWDLARAIGADTRLPDPLVSFALRELSGYADRLAASGLFDPPLPVPAHADSLTRLLALTGRDPGAVSGADPGAVSRADPGAVSAADPGAIGAATGQTGVVSPS
jgi:hypothetical protein